MKLVKENLEDVLLPKTKEELKDANKRIEDIMNKIRYDFERRYSENPIKDFHYFNDGNGINLTIEFEKPISDENLIDDILYPYPQKGSDEFYGEFPYQPHNDEDAVNFYENLPEIDYPESKIVNAVFPLSIINIDEGFLGGGGAGYAVYGGGGGGFGNPSLGGRFSGRGTGFGGSANLHGGPNLMYTYEVKPLTQTLQQPPTPQDDEQYIHVGSKIKGNIINSAKEIEGNILAIEEDDDNNVKWYLVLDEEGIKQKVDPTTAYLVEPEDIVDYSVRDVVDEGFFSVDSDIKNFIRYGKFKTPQKNKAIELLKKLSKGVESVHLTDSGLDFIYKDSVYKINTKKNFIDLNGSIIYAPSDEILDLYNTILKNSFVDENFYPLLKQNKTT